MHYYAYYEGNLKKKPFEDRRNTKRRDVGDIATDFLLNETNVFSVSLQLLLAWSVNCGNAGDFFKFYRGLRSIRLRIIV